MTASELNIYQRIHAIMKDVAYVQKESQKVNNQYTFVSHDAVTAKCRVAFLKHGVLVRPFILKHDIEWYDTKTEKWIDKKKQLVDGKSLRTSIEIEVEFINVDKPEEKMVTNSVGYGLDPQDKGAGKAYSYAYKYALLKALMLETGDDPEKDIIEHVPAKPKKPAKPMSTRLKAAVGMKLTKDTLGAWEDDVVVKEAREGLSVTESDELKTVIGNKYLSFDGMLPAPSEVPIGGGNA